MLLFLSRSDICVSLRRPLSPFGIRHGALQWIIWGSAAELGNLPGFRQDTAAPWELGIGHLQGDQGNHMLYLSLFIFQTNDRKKRILFLDQVNNTEGGGALQKAEAKINGYLTRLQILLLKFRPCIHSSLSLPPLKKGSYTKLARDTLTD